MLLPERRRPGARGRIGVIQPAPGVMLEHEWPAWLPPDILFPVARVRMTSATAEGYARIAQAAPDAARDLAAAGADVVAFACTVGSLFDGPAAEAELIASLTEAARVPAISLSATSVEALHRVRARRVAVMTPYSEETNGWVAAYLEAQGFAVEGFIATPVGIAEVGNLHPAEIAAIAIDALAGLPNADALWVPCTAIQTMAAIAPIEAAADRPVVSGAQALLWHALGVLGIPDPIRGGGQLFQSSPVLETVAGVRH